MTIGELYAKYSVMTCEERRLIAAMILNGDLKVDTDPPKKTFGEVIVEEMITFSDPDHLTFVPRIDNPYSIVVCYPEAKSIKLKEILSDWIDHARSETVKECLNIIQDVGSNNLYEPVNTIISVVANRIRREVAP